MVSVPRRECEGFTYLFVLILVAMLAGVLAAAGTRWGTIDQRSREAELLRQGSAIRDAIGAYYQSTPGTVKRFPPNLQGLLLDSRYLGVRRYLRKIPYEPFSRDKNWGLVSAPDGGVMGVYSQSEKTPFKSENFAALDSTFTGAAHYSDWHFVYVLPSLPVPSAQAIGFPQKGVSELVR
jgi:type II secretory pathway pseudopilin PulG